MLNYLMIFSLILFDAFIFLKLYKILSSLLPKKPLSKQYTEPAIEVPEEKPIPRQRYDVDGFRKRMQKLRENAPAVEIITNEYEIEMENKL